MKIVISRFVIISSLVAICLVLIPNKLFSQDLRTALKYSQGERYDDADSIFKEVLKSNPTNGDAWFYYGENILKSYIADPYSNSLVNVAKDATEAFKKGISVDSTDQLNYIGMGMVILLQKNDTLAADVYFKKAELLFPKKVKKYNDKNITALIELGTAQLYAKNPRYQKAVSYLAKAIELAPKNTDVYISLGDVYVDQNNASEAVKNYNKAVFIDPKLFIPLVKIGNLYMRSRNLEEARNYFEKAKSIDSTYAPLYKGLGEMYSLSSHDNLSILNYRKFLALSGNNIPAKIQYLISLFRAKKYTEANTLVEEILNYDKSRNYLYRLAAYSSYEKKQPDYQKALNYIELFFKNSPPDKIITRDYAYYGRTLLKLRDKDTTYTDKAFEKLMIAYKLDTVNHDLVSDISLNAYNTKRYSLAIEMLNKKINFGKSGLNDYYLLGKAYYQTAQYEKAISTFDKALGIEPDNMTILTWKASTYVAMDPTQKTGLPNRFTNK